MSEPIRSIQETLTVPKDLIEAVKKGERLEPTAKSRRKRDTAGTHVRRISGLVAAYACIALLLIGVTLIPNLFPSAPIGTQSVDTTLKEPTRTTAPYTTPPLDEQPYFPAPETPMVEDEVEAYMESRTLLNDKIDMDSLYSSAVGIYYDGVLSNLFDDVYTNAEWEKAEREGRFEEATHTVDFDADGDDKVDEDDVIVELGKMCINANDGVIYWSMTEAVVLDGYVVYSGNDSTDYPARNPIVWRLYATNDDSLAAKPDDLTEWRTSLSVLCDSKGLEEAGWILLDDVYDSAIKDVDGEPFGYTIDMGVKGAYKHYCWVLEYDGEDGSIKAVNGMKLFADPEDDWMIVPPPETPMVEDEVEAYMESHTLLNDRIDMDSLFTDGIDIERNGLLTNLFDDIFTTAEWEKAEREGRFEEATHKVDFDADGDGFVDENDYVVELGAMILIGDHPMLYWSMTEAVTLDGYVIYTGNDNSEHPGCVPPYGWQLYATNDSSLAAVPEDANPMGYSISAFAEHEDLINAGWVLIDNVYESNMANNVDGIPFGYTIDEEAKGAYKHYCLVMSDHAGEVSITKLNGMKLFAAD